MTTHEANKEVHDDLHIAENCVFCKIIRNEIPAVKVYEDADTLAFLDITPDTRGHVLVIPKTHFENIYGLPAEDWLKVNLAVQKIAVAIKTALSADGINIIMNNESAANQIVFHAHVHVIPRYNDFKDAKYTYIAGEMEDVAKEIAEVI